MVDNIGVPVSGINITYNNTGTIGSQDGEIQIKLTPDHAPTADYMRQLRRDLPERFPGITFSFLPADIVSQILNFGAPSPIDIQVAAPISRTAFDHANRMLARLRQVPGVVDARIQQSRDRAGVRRRCRPHAGAVCRPHHARRHQLPGGQSRRQRPGRSRPTG